LPPSEQQSPAPRQNPPGNQDRPEQQEGQGSWGELAPQAMPVGSRREVPSWPKKP
jgi:magnesium chelatase subunit I